MKDISYISQLVKEYGNPSSIALFDQNTLIFSVPSIGVIGYRNALNCAIVLGEPVCAQQHVPIITKAFFNYCQEQRKKIIYVPVSSDYVEHLKSNHTICSMSIGKEIILDSNIDRTKQTGPDSVKLRNKLKQAQRNLISVKEYIGNDPLLELAFGELNEHWLKSRKGPQVFQWQVDLFNNRLHKRWFYAEQNNKILGLIILNEVKDSWALNIAMILPEAPRYLSEAMFLEILNILREEGGKQLSIGSIPSPKIESIDGLGKISKLLAKTIYQTTQKIFKLGDGQAYWKKFNPQLKPMHVVFSGTRIRITDVAALIRAFNAHF